MVMPGPVLRQSRKAWRRASAGALLRLALVKLAEVLAEGADAFVRLDRRPRRVPTSACSPAAFF